MSALADPTDRQLRDPPALGARATRSPSRRRNLQHIRHVPEKLLDVTLQPVIFVLLFAYVFGSAIAMPGGSYHEYLMGGIFVQTLAFGDHGHRPSASPTTSTAA